MKLIGKFAAFLTFSAKVPDSLHSVLGTECSESGIFQSKFDVQNSRMIGAWLKLSHVSDLSEDMCDKYFLEWFSYENYSEHVFRHRVASPTPLKYLEVRRWGDRIFGGSGLNP